MKRALAVAALLGCTGSLGCLSFKQVGITKDPITVTETVPLVCLDASLQHGGGRQAVLTEGTLRGKPSVAIDGVLTIGFSYAFTEATPVDGNTAFVGQECLPRYDGVVCDRGLYLRTKNRRFFVYWAAVEMTSDAAAQKAITDTTPSEMMKRPDVARLVEKLGALDLDDETAAAMAELSRARNTRKKWNLVKLASGVALQQLGPAVSGKVSTELGKRAKELGKDMTDAAVSPDVDEADLALIAAHPKLADLFLLDGFGTVCAGPLSYPK